jgi:DNA invertase Pin-like site-specific DNA recombinase
LRNHHIEVIDDDLCRSAAGGVQRAGFERMVAEVCLGKVGTVCAREVSRFARNSRDWQQLIEMCRVVDTVLIDQETIYAPRHGNDRLLLGLKGSLNEYELDLLRQRSLSARYEKARRGELVVSAPVGFVKAGDRYEKDPDRPMSAGLSVSGQRFSFNFVIWAYIVTDESLYYSNSGPSTCGSHSFRTPALRRGQSSSGD